VALEELSVADEELRHQNEELARSRDEIDRERAKYLELFEFAPDPYLVTDSAGVIREANHAATHLFGVAHDFLVGKPLLTYFEEPARRGFRQQLDRLCGVDRLDDWEITLKPRNGETRPISVSIARVTGKDKAIRGYRWILRDIAQRKHAEDALRQANRELEMRVAARTTQLAAANQLKDELLVAERKAREQAEVSNRVKSEFLALLSHEFRTPLQAIFGYTELLERELHGPLTDSQRRDLQRIQQSEQHLLGLINTILEYAKLDSAQPIEISTGPIAMNEALSPMEALVGPSLETKKLRYVYEVTDQSVTAYADAAKVRQIVLNLLANAIKFTEPGGQIALGCAVIDGQVEVWVRDTGRGIPMDKLEAIFEPFVQLRVQGAMSAGTGLGLAISRRLALAMGGVLTAASTVGEGSVFTLRLPRYTPGRYPRE
ncbi:MAG TPA: ATP-binding protein, partial [Gemmatimonadaceae bacterium]|nr:ATP-binding protein [Gemmatimonadaceae bacterium]